MYTDNKLISEVEKNQKLLKLKDVLIYTDASNSEKWIVNELFEGSFNAIDNNGHECFFFFKDLQKGWSFTEKTKQQNFLNYRFRYVS